MHFPPPREPTNKILDHLGAAERKRVLAACEPVRVEIGEPIYRQDARIQHVYFPLDSMFSELTPGSTPALEAFLTGREGMMGAVLAIGATRAAMDCGVQGTGGALRMRARDFVAALHEERGLRRYAHATLYYQLQQTARNVYCMRHHAIVERLARWLLMARDRHESRRFTLTHKFLAAMLGTRRAGVTVAARMLSKGGTIRYRRGEIEILDPRALEAAACSCYGFTQQAQRNIFRPSK